MKKNVSSSYIKFMAIDGKIYPGISWEGTFLFTQNR